MMLGHGRKTWQARLTLKTSRKLRELTTTRLKNLSVITSHGAGPQLVGLGPPENYRYHSNPFIKAMTISDDCLDSQVLEVITEKMKRDRISADALLATQKVFNSLDTLSLPV